MVYCKPAMKDINRAYLDRLKRMSPAKRLMIALELTEIVKGIAIAGIKSSNAKLKRTAVVRKLRARMAR